MVQVARSVLGTGPKWSSGHFSGAVSVWPGGSRFGSMPSGMRLRLKRPTPRVYEGFGRRIPSGSRDRERPCLLEGLAVDGAVEGEGVATAGGKRILGQDAPLVRPQLGRVHAVAGDRLAVRPDQLSRLDLDR